MNRNSRRQNHLRMLARRQPSVHIEAPLNGSPKQIAWATDIRDRFASCEMSDSNRFVFGEVVETKIRAAWWIDHRDLSLSELCGAFVEECGLEAEASMI